MKPTTIIKSAMTTVIGLTLITGTAMARKPGKHHHLHRDKDGEHAAAIEELLLDQKDTHGAHVEEGKDRRSSNISTYHTQTFTRIKALLKSGKITEAEGTEYKTEHEAITKALADAKNDGTMTSDEIKSIRKGLDDLNDTLTIIAGDGDEDLERTPLVNGSQHRIEEMIEFGLRSGRLSTLEANGIKRDLARLVSLEDRVKNDKEVTTKEREKLFEEIGEIRREIHKSLHD